MPLELKVPVGDPEPDTVGLTVMILLVPEMAAVTEGTLDREGEPLPEGEPEELTVRVRVAEGEPVRDAEGEPLVEALTMEEPEAEPVGEPLREPLPQMVTEAVALSQKDCTPEALEQEEALRLPLLVAEAVREATWDTESDASAVLVGVPL